jgi:hypothetical protein
MLIRLTSCNQYSRSHQLYQASITESGLIASLIGVWWKLNNLIPNSDCNF